MRYADAREVSRTRRVDDRRRFPSGEGSPRAHCDRDSATLAQGVGGEGTVRGLRHRRRCVPAKDPEIDRALEALSAPELRAAVRAVLDELDEDVKASVVDTLIGRARSEEHTSELQS